MSPRTRLAKAEIPAAGQRGFTLLEVLVAIVLMGFAYAGILGALSQSLKLARSAAEHENAVILANSLLEENRALPRATIVETDKRGDVFGGTQYAYKVEVHDIPYLGDLPPDKAKPAFELKQILVDVYWGQPGQQKHYRVGTYQSVPLGQPEAGQGTAGPAKDNAAQGTQPPPATKTADTKAKADANKKP